MNISKEELCEISSPFTFNEVSNLILPKFKKEVIKIAENKFRFHENPISTNYILLQVNEIGMDKANDIAFISYNKTNMFGDSQEYLVKGERMKFEYALAVASAYCLSLKADGVYYFINEDFKWK